MDLSGVDVEDLVTRLDLKNARLSSSGQELNYSCFGAEHSHGDESPSAYINVETTAWFCHGCKRRGNAVTLVMETQQVERATAERFLRDTYGIEFMEPIGGSMVAETEARFRELPPEPDPPRPPRSWLSSVRLSWAMGSDADPFQEYMIKRGFSPLVLDDWDIGYDYLSDRLTIPLFDIDGEPFGIKGRAWRDGHMPKYLVLGDKPTDEVPRYGFAPYEAANVVFGLHRNRDCRRGVLCEGELNAVALSQIGVERPIATGMSYLSQRHLELITRELDVVTIYYDYGKAGHEGVWGRRSSAGQMMLGAAQMLEPYVRVFVVNATPEDPAKLLELGRGGEALKLINDAPSALASSLVFV